MLEKNKNLEPKKSEKPLTPEEKAAQKRAELQKILASIRDHYQKAADNESETVSEVKAAQAETAVVFKTAIEDVEFRQATIKDALLDEDKEKAKRRKDFHALWVVKYMNKTYALNIKHKSSMTSLAAVIRGWVFENSANLSWSNYHGGNIEKKYAEIRKKKKPPLEPSEEEKKRLQDIHDTRYDMGLKKLRFNGVMIEGDLDDDHQPVDSWNLMISETANQKVKIYDFVENEDFQKMLKRYIMELVPYDDAVKEYERQQQNNESSEKAA